MRWHDGRPVDLRMPEPWEMERELLADERERKRREATATSSRLPSGASISLSWLGSEPAVGEAELGELVALEVDDGDPRQEQLFLPEGPAATEEPDEK